MAQQRLVTSLVVVLAIACAANAGFAQTQATTVNGAQTSGGQDQSAAAQAQEAINPFATSWLMQLQQNNNRVDMPLDSGDRVQSNLVFQPLLSLRLTEKQGLVVRPMVNIVNSIPHFDQSGQNERTVGFGDTVLAFALPRSLLGGRLTVGAGPTFIFPTASKDLLSQDTWQVGPDVGAAFLGKNFITYAFVQQWFKVGGDGEDTNHMNGTFNFTYMLANGFTIGTQPNLSVDWEAPEDNRVTFSIGPRSSRRRRSDVERSVASDSDDSGPPQESALLRTAAMATSASANELSVDTRRAGAHAIVLVTGRVTVDSSPRLRPVLHEAIGAAPPAGVVIDFTAVRYLDTAAIATLLEAATLASERGVALGVIGLGGETRLLAEATELDRIFLEMGHEVQFT
jgi:anti-anti-sigma factor